MTLAIEVIFHSQKTKATFLSRINFTNKVVFFIWRAGILPRLPIFRPYRHYHSKIHRYSLIVARFWKKFKIDGSLSRDAGDVVYILEEERR